MRVSQSQRGINIVKMSNGTVKKVIVKQFAIVVCTYGEWKKPDSEKNKMQWPSRKRGGCCSFYPVPCKFVLCFVIRLVRIGKERRNIYLCNKNKIRLWFTVYALIKLIYKSIRWDIITVHLCYRHRSRPPNTFEESSW